MLDCYTEMILHKMMWDCGHINGDHDRVQDDDVDRIHSGMYEGLDHEINIEDL